MSTYKPQSLEDLRGNMAKKVEPAALTKLIADGRKLAKTSNVTLYRALAAQGFTVGDIGRIAACVMSRPVSYQVIRNQLANKASGPSKADQLAAAHARVAELEAEVAELQSQSQRTKPATKAA